MIKIYYKTINSKIRNPTTEPTVSWQFETKNSLSFQAVSGETSGDKYFSIAAESFPLSLVGNFSTNFPCL